MSTSDLWSTPTVGGECQDFTRWWNSEGQFLQPIGDMQSEYGLDFAKKIAESVYTETRANFDEEVKTLQGSLERLTTEIEDAAEKTESALSKRDALISEIEKTVQIVTSTKDEHIKLTIQEYRETLP